MTARLSPDAEAARAAFLALRDRVQDVIRGSQSGQELIEAGYAGDVEIAIEMDASPTVPLLHSDGYADAPPDLIRT